jgi:hypothetical protein
MKVSKSWWVWLLAGVLCACGPGLSGGGERPPVTPNPVPEILQAPEVSYADEDGREILISVTGEGFFHSSSILVSGNNTQVPTTYVSSTRLTAKVSPTELFDGIAISVRNPMPGGGQSAVYSLSLSSLRPVIESLEPLFVEDSPCTTLLHGRNLLRTSKVWPPSREPLFPTYLDSQTLRLILPAEYCARAQEFPIYISNPKSDTSEPVRVVVGYPRPVLEEVSPRMISSGMLAPGVTLRLRGSGILSSLTEVRWNGVRVESSRDPSDPSRFVAVIPPWRIPSFGPVAVTLHNPAPGEASNPLTVIVQNGPVLQWMSPAGCATSAGNVTVSVQGSNFRESMILYFGDQPRPTRVSGTEYLQADLSASDVLLAGVVPITVRSQDGTRVSNPLSFSISEQRAAPVLEYVSPSTLAAGSAATVLQVWGAGFHPTSRVLWNGQERPTSFVYGSFLRVSLSAQDLEEAGTGQLIVYTPGGGSSLPVLFNLEPRRDSPFILRVSPSHLATGTGARQVRVEGLGFHPASVIRWNGVALPTVLEEASLYESSLTLSAMVPESLLTTPGTVKVTVFTPAPGGGVSNPRTLALHSPAEPELGALSPSTIEVGTPRLTLSVASAYGGGPFDPATFRVRVGTRERVPLPSSTSSQLDVDLDAHDLSTPGILEVRVYTAGKASAPLFLDVLPRNKPKLRSIRPGVVPVGAWKSSGQVWVNGANFLAPDASETSPSLDTLLLWNDTPLVLTSIQLSESGSVSVDAAEAGSVGIHRVSLTRLGAASGEASLTALVNVTQERPVPHVSSLLPASTPAGGPALELSLPGAGFHPSSVVYWNDLALTTTWKSGTSLHATVPASALATPGDARVTVFTPGPGGGRSMPGLFRVLP